MINIVSLSLAMASVGAVLTCLAPEPRHTPIAPAPARSVVKKKGKKAKKTSKAGKK